MKTTLHIRLLSGLWMAFFSLTALAQTTISSTQNGPWTTATTWVGGTAPGTGSLANNVSISHAVSLNTDLSLSGSSNLTITINSGGTLSISPSSFTATGGWGNTAMLTILIKSGGKLTLSGTGTHIFKGYSYVTVQSGGQLSASGTVDFVNNGFFTAQTGATSVSFSTLQIDYNNNGSSNTVTINSGAIVSASVVTIGNNSAATLSNAGTLSVTGDLDSEGTISNSGTINVGGNFTQENSGNTATSSGNINVTGNAYAYGKIQLNPAASANSDMIVNGSLYVTSNQNMSVGTGSTCTSSTYYADLVVKTNVNLTGSGDIKVYSNGRLVVFGNINGSTSSGTLVTVNCGGQAYINGNINLGTGGGNTLTNSNSASSPTGSDGSPMIGLYVNGTTTAQNVSGSEGTKAQLQTNDYTFFTYIASITGSPLPITLSEFKISGISGTSIDLVWTTATELNFNYFEIERSTDGRSFMKIGQIEGHGTSNQPHHYEFTDTEPMIGLNYYRLKSVDFDQFTETFNVLATNFRSSKQISIYPNPVSDQTLHIDFNFENDGPVIIEITDGLGNQKMSITTDQVQNSLPLHLESGVYIVSVHNGTFKTTSRLVIK